MIRAVRWRAGWTLVLLLLALFAAACGDDEADQGGSVQPQGGELDVTLGTKDFTESVIVGELYRQALKVKGYNVNLRKDIGPTEVIDKELQSGKIDGYPEYLGVAVTVAAGRQDAGRTADETYELAKDFYAGRSQALSEQTPFENVDAIATTQFFAQKRGLATIGDLRKLEGFTLGARPEFRSRQEGLVGMRDVYRLENVKYVEVWSACVFSDSKMIQTIGNSENTNQTTSIRSAPRAIGESRR